MYSDYVEDGLYTPEDIVQKVYDLGEHVFVAHVKTGSEGLWYSPTPSAVPEAVQDPMFYGKDIVNEYVTAAYNMGMKFIAYNQAHYDNRALELHPDWAASPSNITAHAQQI